MRRLVAAILAGLLTSPGAGVASPSTLGTVRGAVTIANRPLGGVSLAFVDIASGSVFRASSDAQGRFAAELPAGRYAVAAESGSGLAIDQAPAIVAVTAGGVAEAMVALLAQPGAAIQEPAAQPPAAAPEQPPGVPPVEAPPTATVINHQAIGCMVAGQFPLVDAVIEPASAVSRARVYFRSALSDTWFYVEMMPLEAGGFAGKLPRPKLEASPVTYYIQATTTTFGEAQTPEIQADVVESAEDCQDRRMAPAGPPGEVTVFSAATGTAIAPAGFAAGGLALTAGTLAVVAGGAAAAGITAAVTVFNPEPTPPPTSGGGPTPPPATPAPPTTPSPSPSPEPTPPPATPFR